MSDTSLQTLYRLGHDVENARDFMARDDAGDLRLLQVAARRASSVIRARILASVSGSPEEVGGKLRSQ